MAVTTDRRPSPPSPPSPLSSRPAAGLRDVRFWIVFGLAVVAYLVTPFDASWLTRWS